MVFRRLLVLVIAFIALAINPLVVLGNGAELLFSDSPGFLWTKYDLIQQGKTLPTSVFPITKHEYADTFLNETLPPAAGTISSLIFTARPYLALASLPPGNSDTLGYRLAYLQSELAPLVELGNAFSLDNWFHARLVMDVSPAYPYLTNDHIFKTNLAINRQYMQFPRQGYLSIAREGISLAAGRFQSGIGHGYFGNTFLNSQAPYYDQIQGAYYGNKFKFFYLLGSSQSQLTPEEALIQSDTKLYDGGGPAVDGPIKLFAYHRVEFRPSDNLTLGFGELNIIGGKFPDFSHINPFGFWHNTFSPRYSNVMASADVSWVPRKGLHLYSEFTMDDKRLGGSDDKPTAVGYQLGSQYVLHFSDQVKHVVGAEFTHADTWMYNRWQPYLTMYQRQYKDPRIYLDIPLGFPYGGDLNHYGFYYTMAADQGGELKVSYHHLDKGATELGLNDEGVPYYPTDLSDDTHQQGPSGIVEKWDTITISLSRPLSDKLRLSAAAEYSWVSNHEHIIGDAAYLALLRTGLNWSF